MARLLAVACCLVGLVVCVAGCSEQTAGKKKGAGQKRKGVAAGSLAGKKALFVIAPKDFRDEELLEPTAVLKEKGCAVAVACSSLDPATGMMGATAKPDVLLKDAKADDYDAIVFVGGSGANVYFDDPTAHALAKDAAAKGKVLAAICIAPSILARAGLLKGKNATSWASQQGDLEAHGATWVANAAVRDGRLVTGFGPKAAQRFAETVAEALAERAKP